MCGCGCVWVCVGLLPTFLSSFRRLTSPCIKQQSDGKGRNTCKSHSFNCCHVAPADPEFCMEQNLWEQEKKHSISLCTIFFCLHPAWLSLCEWVRGEHIYTHLMSTMCQFTCVHLHIVDLSDNSCRVSIKIWKMWQNKTKHTLPLLAHRPSALWTQAAGFLSFYLFLWASSLMSFCMFCFPGFMSRDYRSLTFSFNCNHRFIGTRKVQSISLWHRQQSRKKKPVEMKVQRSVLAHFDSITSTVF